jgi:nucleoid-associated protein YgaU
MTRETKAGLLMIAMLCGVFGFMVYKRLHQPSTALAQQNPAGSESTSGPPEGEGAGDSVPPPTDSILAGQGEFSESHEIIRTVATTPAPMPMPGESETPGSEKPRDDAGGIERDPFGETIASSPPPTLPRLPTSVPDDERVPTRVPERFSGVSSPSDATAAQPVPFPDVPQKVAGDGFDPFETSSTEQIPDEQRSPAESAKAPDRSGNAAAPAALNDSDPFAIGAAPPAGSGSAKAIVDPPANRIDAANRNAEPKVPLEFDTPNDPFPRRERPSPDGFEAPVVVNPSAPAKFEDVPPRETPPREVSRSEVSRSEVPRSEVPQRDFPQREVPRQDFPPKDVRPRDVSADPFATNENLETQRAADSTPARATGNEAADPGFDRPKPIPATVPKQNPDESFDQPPARSRVPELTIPSRDSNPVDNRRAAPADDRLGGFRPATPTDAPANALSSDERPSPRSFPGDAGPRRTPRPAPVTPIDEDFGAQSTTRPLVAGDTYQIEPNDNYWTISRKKYGTGRYFMALAQHNTQVITDPKRMRPGVTIATPSADALERAYPQLIPKVGAIDPVQTASVSTPAAESPARPAQAEEDSEAGFFIANDGTPMYRVGREDTLSGISQRHLGRSSRWVQVFEMNRDVLPDGNTLKIGAVLRLPADASRVEVVGGGATFR